MDRLGQFYADAYAPVWSVLDISVNSPGPGLLVSRGKLRADAINAAALALHFLLADPRGEHRA